MGRERELDTHLIFCTCNVSVNVCMFELGERAKDSLEEARESRVGMSLALLLVSLSLVMMTTF